MKETSPSSALFVMLSLQTNKIERNICNPFMKEKKPFKCAFCDVEFANKQN